MIAWTSQYHSCRLILSELHVAASDSSAEFTTVLRSCVHNQVMFSAVWFLCAAQGRTVSTVEEKWTILGRKRIEKVCSEGKV